VVQEPRPTYDPELGPLKKGSYVYMSIVLYRYVSNIMFRYGSKCIVCKYASFSSAASYVRTWDRSLLEQMCTYM